MLTENLITIDYSIRAKKNHELNDMQSKKLVNDLYRAMCNCYNDHRSHRVKKQDTAFSSLDLPSSLNCSTQFKLSFRVELS